MSKAFFTFILIISYFSLSVYGRERIDMSGEWLYRLIGAPSSIPGEGYITLPSTLDESKKSIYNPESDNTTQLRSEFSFIGIAEYSKDVEIPDNWRDKDIELFIERTKPTSIKVDGKEAGYNSRISSPQRYNLTEYLTPGRHKIEITVNNADSIPPIVARSSHAVSESTQTNWNGILGDFYLEAKDKLHIRGVEIDEDLSSGKAMIKASFSIPAPSDHTLTLYKDGVEFSKDDIKEGLTSIDISIPLSKDDLWSGWSPNLHDLEFVITNANGGDIENYAIETGFREFKSGKDNFSVNGIPLFLRGTVNAAVFPLTAYAPIDKESWDEYFSVLKEYGLNHVRFHSWTPPEAAFQAADEAGIYILTELPMWGELDRDLKFHNRFLKAELEGIMESYGHHPSFVMFSPGNELWGDISLMGEYMQEAREMNPRILSTYGTNLYLGMNGEIGGEDFLVSAKTGDEVDSTSVRGSVSFVDSSTGGYINSSYPSNDFTFSHAVENIGVPVIVHEAGQYQTYPDFSEIEKYTGSLKPDNLKEFQRRALKAGTFRKNEEFVKASGKWAAKLYKAEMESAQRTQGIGGIELFGLQDYPGQGTALVGILDPFMQSKKMVSPQEFRQSSADVVLQAAFPKYTFTEGEEVEIPILKINYSENPDTVPVFYWQTGFDEGEKSTESGRGIIEIEPLKLKMPRLKEAKKFDLSLRAGDGAVSNTYSFWVYPKELKDIENVTVTDNLTEALILLDQGERVILCPDSATIAKASLDPLFVPDFWNYRMYRSISDAMHLQASPGTLGLYVNAAHPALKKFPTEAHTDWQWFSIIKASRPLIIDRLPNEFDPIVEVIDNVERNFRLSLMLECNVGKGKLMILSADMEKASQYPEGRWFLQSVKEYMVSKECKPAVTLTPEQVVNLVTKPSNSRLIKELKNETYNQF